MERLQLTQAQQEFIDDYRSSFNVDPQAELTEGTNLVVDDHLQVDNNWYAIILGPSPDSPGCLDCYMPDWGEFWLPIWQIEAYVTDRAGPNGETMPIFESPPGFAAAQAQGAAANPQLAASAQPKHPRRRPFREVLLEAVQRKMHLEREELLSVLRAKGALREHSR